MTRVRHLAGSLLVAGTLTLSACSSSGGSAPSEDKILGKLKQEDSLTSLKTSLPAKDKNKFDAFLACAAKALRKDASSSDLNDYVKGKKKLEDISGNKDAAKTDVKKCLTSLGISTS